MSAPTLRWIAAAVIAASAHAVAAQTFPKHWGDPPSIQTRDFRPLPGGYGNGSSTLARWIQQNLDRDAAGGAGTSKPRGIAAGKGASLSGHMIAGRRVTLTLDGPPADGSEHDYRVSVRFIHKSGSPERTVQASLNKDARWVVQFTPEKPGQWIYRVSFSERKPGEAGKTDAPVPGYHGRSGSFTIAAPPRTGSV